MHRGRKVKNATESRDIKGGSLIYDKCSWIEKYGPDMVPKAERESLLVI